MKKSKANIPFKNILSWGNMLLSAFLVLGIFVFLDIISFNRNISFDLTPDRLYTLSDQAKKVLDSLDDVVHVKTFYRMGERSRYEKFYDIFTFYSPKVTVQLIDLERNPGQARMEMASSPGYTVIRHKGKTSYVNPPTEESIINAILKLTQNNQKHFYILHGHGERTDTDKLKQSLITENWQVESVSLRETDWMNVKQNSVLMIAGPKIDLTEAENAVLERYVVNGGKLVVLCEPFTALPNLETFLAKFRIDMPDSIIVDYENRLFGGDYLVPLIPFYSNEPVTGQVRSASVFPTARPVDTLASNFSAPVSAIVIASSSKQSWTKTSREDIKRGRTDYREGVDRPGPIPVAMYVALTGKNEKGLPAEGEIICFGDSDFINDAFFEIMGNRDFFLNCVEWLGRDYSLISIRQKSFKNPYHFLSRAQGRFLLVASVVVLPMIFLGAAVISFLFRRMRG